MPRTHDMERAGQDMDIGRTGTTGVNREVFSCLICHFIQSATLILTRYYIIYENHLSASGSAMTSDSA